MTNDYPTADSAVRPLVAHDLAPLRDLIDATGMFPGEMLDEMTRAYLDGQVDTGRWLVFDDGAARGLAYYVPERMTDGTWNLLLIAVHPDLHGRGIGKRLMAAVERELATGGARILLVETSGLPEFERTRAFYRMLGYEEEGRIRDFYQAGEDKIIFRRAI